MSAQKPNFRRVISDSWRIISSSPLHFLALSALFIFPTYGRRLLSMQQDSDFLYNLSLFLFNFCSVPSITHSIFNGFHSKPVTLSSSLKSIISSFIPLIVTNLVTALLIFAYSLLTAFSFVGLTHLGFAAEPNIPDIVVFCFVNAAVFLVMFVYFKVEWLVVDASVVVESKMGLSAFRRSSKLVKGARGVGLLILLCFGVVEAMLWVLASRSNGGGWAVGVYGVASTLVSLFRVAAQTVFFINCREFNGELEIPTYDKLGEVYVPLSRDVDDHV